MRRPSPRRSRQPNLEGPSLRSPSRSKSWRSFRQRKPGLPTDTHFRCAMSWGEPRAAPRGILRCKSPAERLWKARHPSRGSTVYAAKCRGIGFKGSGGRETRIATGLTRDLAASRLETIPLNGRQQGDGNGKAVLPTIGRDARLPSLSKSSGLPLQRGDRLSDALDEICHIAALDAKGEDTAR